MENQFFTVFSKSDIRELIYGAVHEAIKTVSPAPAEQPPHDRFLTRKETAEKLKVSLPTLNDWSKRGLLKSYIIGGRVLYKANEIEQSLHEVKTVKY